MNTLDMALANLERTRDDFRRAALFVRALQGIDVDRVAGLLDTIAEHTEEAASGVRFLMQARESSTPETRAVALNRLYGAS